MSAPAALEVIASRVAADYGDLLREDILSNHRGRPRAASARRLCMVLWRYGTRSGEPRSMTQVGRDFGRDRTTVRHALDLYRRLYGAKEAELRDLSLVVLARLGLEPS